MFRIIEKKEAKNSGITLINTDTQEHVEILPNIGGMVNSLVLRSSAAIYSVLAPGGDSDLEQNPWFRNRLLFPFHDRIPDGIYSYNQMQYQLPCNNMEDGSALHGLVYDKEFQVISKVYNDDHCILRLQYAIQEESFPGYPFAIDLVVEYRLDFEGFSMRFTVTNTDEKPVPFTAGWHPYFSFENSLNDVTIKAASDTYIPMTEALVPTGEILSVENTDIDFRTPRPLGSQELDIILKAPLDNKTFLCYKENQLIIEQDGDFFKYLQIFIPPDKRSVAIEPVTAAANAFNNHALGLTVLNPKESRTGTVKIYFAD